MEEKRNTGIKDERRHTQWEGLFVSQHVWDTDEHQMSDPQPMLSADEHRAIMNMLVAANERKCAVFLQSWQDRHFHFHHCTIQEINYAERVITYEDRRGEWQLPIDAITSMYMLDKE